jgi:hypothetical protein
MSDVMANKKENIWGEQVLTSKSSRLFRISAGKEEKPEENRDALRKVGHIQGDHGSML